MYGGGLVEVREVGELIHSNEICDVISFIISVVKCFTPKCSKFIFPVKCVQSEKMTHFLTAMKNSSETVLFFRYIESVLKYREGQLSHINTEKRLRKVFN